MKQIKLQRKRPGQRGWAGLKNCKAEVRKVVPQLLLALALSITGATAIPRVINVPADQPSIQQAIDAASNGDTVLVAAGTYHELLDFHGKAITLASVAGPAMTILDGDYSGAILTFQTGEGTNSIVCGFTLQRGFSYSGGAITLAGTSPQILGNIFDGNWQAPGGFGAAIAGDSSSPIVLRNVFRGNHADSQPLSGIVSFINDSSPLLAENLFLSNDFRCLNLFLTDGNTPRLFNNLFRGNTLALRTVVLTNDTAPLFENNIFMENGNALLAELPVEPSAAGWTLPGWDHNLVYHNAGDYVGLADQSGTNGNIAADPLFVCPVQNDFHLLPGSPCIDHGNNFVMKFVRTDFEGAPRNVDGDGNSVGMVDIGPFEFDPAVERTPCLFVICPQNITVQAPAGARFMAVDYPAPAASVGASVTTSPASGALFQAGTNIVTCVATSGTNSAVCSFLVTVLAAPGNDDFSAATMISHLPYTNSQDTSLATVGPDDMFCGGIGGSVWYRITSQVDQDIYVDAAGSDFPVSVSAYTGPRGTLTQVGCALGVLKINATAGQTYNLMVSPFFRATGGNLALRVYAIPALKLQLQINEVGFFDPRSGQAIVFGKVSTTRPCSVRLAGELSQDRGRDHSATADFQLGTVCPQSIVWRVNLPKPSGRFAGGFARIEVAGFAFDSEAGDSADVEVKTLIKLHGADIHLTDTGPPSQAAPKPHIVGITPRR